MRPQTAPAGGQTSTSPERTGLAPLPNFGSNKLGSSVKHKRIRNVSVDLPKHLANGGLQANLVPFKADEIIELVDGILDGYAKLEYLRLLCLSKQLYGKVQLALITSKSSKEVLVSAL